MHPKVTIAIPVYNGANFLAEAIDSALRQTYNNIEVIVVNDGSTDSGATDAVARRYGTQIRYFAQENKGVGGAMNTALAQMTGDVFTWLSHDDIHLPEKVASQIKYYNKLGKRDAILFSDFYLINEAGEIWHETHLPFDQYCKTPMLPLLNGAINGCTLFMPARILREFGPFDERLRYVQDYDLWNRILSRHEFFLQPKPLVKYRIHPGQGTNKPQAAAEADPLWIRMLESRSETERVQLFGSAKKFFVAMTDFLDKTPYKGAAAYARSRIEKVARGQLVSVIVPFFNEIDNVLRAARSVLAQTYPEVELILIDDGSTHDVGPVAALAAGDPRVQLVHQESAGPGTARDRGMGIAKGDYIALLDADGLFLPHKIEWQLAAMQNAGSLFSHTSFYVRYPGALDGFGTIQSGCFSGHVFPEIMTTCPIATPTVMLHHSLVAGGLRFAEDPRVGVDVPTWTWIAQRHEILGIEQPLTMVEWSVTSAALRLDKQLDDMRSLLRHYREDPVLSQCRAQITKVEATYRLFSERYKEVTANRTGVAGLLLRPVIDAAFGTGATENLIRSLSEQDIKAKI